jgi:hypothetical protein
VAVSIMVRLWQQLMVVSRLIQCFKKSSKKENSLNNENFRNKKFQFLKNKPQTKS